MVIVLEKSLTPLWFLCNIYLPPEKESCFNFKMIFLNTYFHSKNICISQILWCVVCLSFHYLSILVKENFSSIWAPTSTCFYHRLFPLLDCMSTKCSVLSQVMYYYAYTFSPLDTSLFFPGINKAIIKTKIKNNKNKNKQKNFLELKRWLSS